MIIAGLANTIACPELRPRKGNRLPSMAAGALRGQRKFSDLAEAPWGGCLSWHSWWSGLVSS